MYFYLYRFVMIQNKLRYFQLIWVNSVVEILHSCDVLHTLLDLRSSEREEPPAGQLDTKHMLVNPSYNLLNLFWLYFPHYLNYFIYL